MITERRQHPRKTPAEFTFIQLEQEFGGRVLNYSQDGLCFETLAPISDTDMVQFWLSFQRHGQIDGVGRITWLNEEKKLGGIAFVHLSRSSRQKLDDWASAGPGTEPLPVADAPRKQESPQALVAEVMQQVLAEKHKTPVTPPPAAKPVDSTNVTEAKATQVLANTHEPESPEGLNFVASSLLTPAAAESAHFWSAAETTAAASPERDAPQSFSTPSSQAVAPAPSQAVPLAREHLTDASPTPPSEPPHVASRKWPVSTPAHSTSYTEYDESAQDQESSPDAMRELVPRRQYDSAQRSQFVRGAAIGIVASIVLAIIVVRFWKPAGHGTPAVDTVQAVSANSSIASGATVPNSPLILTQDSKTSPSSKKVQNVSSLAKPLAVHPSSSTSAAAADSSRASAPEPTSNPVQPPPAPISSGGSNAIPHPGSFANPSAAPPKPFFDLSQQGNAVAPAPDAELGSEQPNVGVDLRTSPWSFRRRNIHGKPPVGGDIRPAELISSVAPHYPDAAKVQRISGEVVIDALIDTHGNVRKAEVVSGPLILRAPALNAVAVWKYKPALLDGKPTEVHETITMKFRPQ